jgi:uncharacterized protein
LSQDSPIEIRRIKEVDIKGGTVLDGFPSAGLANAIASKCFIHSLKTELVAVLDSPSFPALSVINDSEPNFPVRIYANENLKLAIFVSELNFDQSMYKPLAKIILQWTIENECKLLISASGTPLHQIEEKDKKISDPPVYAAGSTKKASRRLQDARIQQLSNGSILGIPALLLNEGAWINLDVIVLLVKVLKDSPDFRAGAVLSETVSKLVPGVSCDVRSLLREAESIEKGLRKNRAEQTQHHEHLYR